MYPVLNTPYGNEASNRKPSSPYKNYRNKAPINKINPAIKKQSQKSYREKHPAFNPDNGYQQTGVYPPPSSSSYINVPGHGAEYISSTTSASGPIRHYKFNTGRPKVFVPVSVIVGDIAETTLPYSTDEKPPYPYANRPSPPRIKEYIPLKSLYPIHTQIQRVLSLPFLDTQNTL